MVEDMISLGCFSASSDMAVGRLFGSNAAPVHIKNITKHGANEWIAGLYFIATVAFIHVILLRPVIKTKFNKELVKEFDIQAQQTQVALSIMSAASIQAEQRRAMRMQYE